MNTLSSNKMILVIISIVLFYVLFAIFSDLTNIQNYFFQLNFFYIFPIFLILLFSSFIRSISQKYLLEKLGITLNLKDSFILFLTGLSMIVTPGGSGQIIKSHFLKQKFNESLEKSIPLVFAERLVDLITLSIILFITLIFVGIIIESLIAISLSLVMMLFLSLLVTHKGVFNFTFKIFSKIKFLKNIFPDESIFSEYFKKIFKTKILCVSTLIVFPSFLLEGFVVYLGFLSFGIDLGFLKSIQLFYTSILYGALSLVPGGLGITEGSLATLLSKEITPIALITSLIIFIRLTTIWFSASVGIITAYFQMYRKN